MNLEVQVDLKGLNEFQSQLFGALLGQGRAGNGDAQRFLKIETGQLAKEIAMQMGPKSLSKGEKKIKVETNRTFFTLEPQVELFTGSRAGGGDLQWLFAYKYEKVNGSGLVGVHRENMMPQLSVEDAKSIMRSYNKKQTKWDRIGTRGKGDKHQGVYEILRIVTRPSVILGVVKGIKEKLGQMKASFAFTANELGSWNSPPAWVSKHFGGYVNGKAVLNRSQETNTFNPFIEFGSRAKGVVSNDKINAAIVRAYQARCRISIKKLKKIIDGFTYDWNTGRVFRPQTIQNN